MPDKQIQCAECKSTFLFTEQAEKKLRELVTEGKIQEYHEPKRCPPCRNARKQRSRSQGS
jgi:hypothetical protein